jgi:hypothetical protein
MTPNMHRATRRWLVRFPESAEYDEIGPKSVIFRTLGGTSSGRRLRFGENRKRARVPTTEQPLVGLDDVLRRKAEAPQRGARELDGGLRACGDEIAVDHSALVDVAIAAAIAGRREVFESRAGVVALVEQTGTSQTRGGTADRRDRHACLEEAPCGFGERLPAADIPHVGAGQDEQVAVGRLQVADQRVGQHANTAHRRDRFERFGDRHHVEPNAGEPPGSQFRKQVTDLPVGERVVEA